MTRFKDQPIARKALILGFLPTACALVIASTAFLVSTFISMRRSVVDDVTTSAAMLADSVNVAVSFNDPATVQELAAAIRENRAIDRACVFDEAGQFLAGYAAPGEACPAVFDAVGPFRRSQIARVQPVVIGTRRIGTVRVVGNLNRLYDTVAAQAIVTLLALAGALGVAWLLVDRLQRAIARPIAELAATADRVSSTDDYSLRAQQSTNDEVGRLVRSFNKMLATVQRTEQERAGLLHREREASRLKDEFLATVSHELRTPLNAILGWTHILTAARPSVATLDRGLETIHRNAQVQTRLIEDLLEVSRLATGKLNLKIEPVDLRDIVRHAIEALLSVAGLKGIALDVRLADEPQLVSGDPDRLQQIVSNLASNAVKFTPTGGTVTVSVAAEDGQAVLRIRDTGIGMAPEFLPDMFERFRQADGSTTREHGGLGLGLAIVRELVQLHHGTVTAHSGGPGQGAEFVVRLPRLQAAPGPPRIDRERPGSTALQGVQVLAVDDNADALEVLTTTLRAAGAEVSTAAAGADAIEQWTRVPADVLICDLAMPDMDGFEVVRRIRELETRSGRRAFAVALSAYATEVYVTRAKESGFDTHVTKPFEPARLVAIVAEGMSRLA